MYLDIKFGRIYEYTVCCKMDCIRNPEINNNSDFSNKKNCKTATRVLARNRNGSRERIRRRVSVGTVKSKRLQTPVQVIIMQKQREHSHYSS